MTIDNAKLQLNKIRVNKYKFLKVARQYEGQRQAMVELEKDIDALDYAIRLIGEVQRTARERQRKIG